MAKRENFTPLNVAVYVRVSTQEQKLHGISVDAQEADCRAWVKEHKHRLVGVYNDAGLSARAKYTKRREMLRLLDDVRAGKIDLIIFTKLDRWFRNVADYYEVQSILETADVKWRAIQEDYETETAGGRFKVNIMLAVAQDEADRTSERIKAAAHYKRQKGEAVGRPALGYKIVDKHFDIDPDTRPGIEAFFDAYLQTLSVKAAMASAREHGIRLNATHAGRILRNPTYHGDAFGVPCPAYITKEQFDAIRANAGKRTRINKTGRVFLFAGLLRCGHCGGAMTSAYTPSKYKEIRYYRCLNHYHHLDACPRGCYANEEQLEKFLLANLSDIVAQTNIHTASPKEKAKAQKNAQQIKSKLERLKDLYIEGEIDRAVYDAKSTAMKQELSALEVEVQEIRPPFVLPADWTDMYKPLPAREKKLFWKKTIREIAILEGQPPLVKF